MITLTSSNVKVNILKYINKFPIYISKNYPICRCCVFISLNIKSTSLFYIFNCCISELLKFEVVLNKNSSLPLKSYFYFLKKILQIYKFIHSEIIEILDT